MRSCDVGKPLPILFIRVGHYFLDVLHHRKAKRVRIEAREARIIKVRLKHNVRVRLEKFKKISVSDPPLFVQTSHNAVVHVGGSPFVHDFGLTLGIKILRDMTHNTHQLALPGL